MAATPLVVPQVARTVAMPTGLIGAVYKPTALMLPTEPEIGGPDETGLYQQGVARIDRKRWRRIARIGRW